jgi:cytochrome c556
MARLATFPKLLTIGLIGWLAFTCGLSVARDGRTAPREIQRAKPPAAPWDRTTAKTFHENAFAELEGERPNFAAAGQRPMTATTGPSDVAAAPAGGGFKWSAMVSEETLTDEIKDMKSVLVEAVASQSDFKGGGYDKAREAFSAVALAFGVIAAYDQEIRWKKDAEKVRDLFARVGSNCKVGTEQSFNESKLRVVDLESLLEGTAPTARADREEDFRWSQVAGRPALMSRLESADGTLAAASASKADFDKAVERVLRDAEIVAVIGEVIQQADYEYHDDDTYRGYASAMRDAALRVREAAQKKDYETARAALGELKKSCDACHGDYRS